MWSRISDPTALPTSSQSSIESDSDPVRTARRRALRLGPPLTVALYAAGTLAGAARLAPLAVAVCCLALAAGLVLTALLTARNLAISIYGSACAVVAGGWLAYAALAAPVVLAARRDPGRGGRGPDPGVPGDPPPPGTGGRAGPAGRRGRRGRPRAAQVAGPAGPHRPQGHQVRRPRGHPGRVPGAPAAAQLRPGHLLWPGPGHRAARGGGPPAARLAAVRARHPGPRGDPARGRAGRAGRDRAAADCAGVAEHHPAHPGRPVRGRPGLRGHPARGSHADRRFAGLRQVQLVECSTSSARAMP